MSVAVLLAGLFGHRHAAQAEVSSPVQDAIQWAGAHWAVLAVLIPVAGALVAAIVNHYLAVARENRTRRMTRGEVRARVYADLAARLLSHCSAVYAGLVNPATADPTAWRSTNVSLRARAQMPDVVDALGRQYVSFMAAIEAERRTLDAIGRNRIGAGAAAIIEAYVPFIDAFGEPEQARRLQKYTKQCLARTNK